MRNLCPRYRAADSACPGGEATKAGGSMMMTERIQMGVCCASFRVLEGESIISREKVIAKKTKTTLDKGVNARCAGARGLELLRTAAGKEATTQITWHRAGAPTPSLLCWSPRQGEEPKLSRLCCACRVR